MGGTLQTGAVLHVRPLATSGTTTKAEKRAVVAALRQLTGQRFGSDARAWSNWYRMTR